MNRIFVFLGCLFALSGCLNDETNTQNGHNNGDFIGPHQVPDPEIRFGVVWDRLVVDSGRVKEGQSLSHILDAYKFGSGKVATLAANAKDVYDKYDECGDMCGDEVDWENSYNVASNVNL